MSLKKIAIVILIVSVVGCNGGNSDDPSSPVPPTPTPTPPPEPAVELPVATNLSVTHLQTSEIYKGNYQYYDKQGRKEGNSIYHWKDDKGNLLSIKREIQDSEVIHNKNIQFCVEPVAYDGSKGSEVCSSFSNIEFSSSPSLISTDWNTDNDFKNQQNNNKVSSGNVHFYYNTSIKPLNPEQYDLQELTVIESVAKNRNFYDPFSMDDIYAEYNEDNFIVLHNNTPRMISEPVIRVNNDYYYIARNTIIQPFSDTTFQFKSDEKVKSISFIDPNPSFILRAKDFPRVIPEGMNDHENQYTPVNEDYTQRYQWIFSTLKLLYNRFDTVKYYFDVMNDFKSIEGGDLSTPFSDASIINTHICNNLHYICGDYNVTAKYAYRLHALKRILSHNTESDFYHLAYSPSAGGVGTISGINTEGMIALSEGMYYPGAGEHENAHRLGYGHDSGVTSDWDDAINVFNHHMDFYSDSNIRTQPIEKNDYFSDYNWIDPLTVDVHFFSSANKTDTLKNMVVIAEDEESRVSVPETSSPEPDYNAYTNIDPSGGFSLTSELEVINDSTIRIHLNKPLLNNNKTLLLLATRSDTNDEAGVWKTDYTHETNDNVSVRIYYDKGINVHDDNLQISFVDNLSDSDNMLKNGSSGHIGHSGKTEVTAPYFQFENSLYQSYSIEEAESECQALGYAGLGKLPFLPITYGEGPMADLIQQFVSGGTIIGKDENGIVKMVGTTPNDSEYHPSSFAVDTSQGKATLLVCSNYSAQGARSNQ